MNRQEQNQQRVIKGLGVSDGIAIGKAFVLERERIAIPHRFLSPDRIPDEIKRFHEARERAKQGLERIKQGLEGEKSREPAFIIDAHIMILDDELLVKGTEELIKERKINAEWALRMKTAELLRQFAEMTDPYIRERARDVEAVVERVVRELVGKTESPVNQIDEPVVVVAHDLSPAETAHLAVDKVLGFATDIGSRTSHTAIVAKSLRIPAVVALKNATRDVNHGDLILIDGHAGLLIVNPYPETVEEYESRRKWLIELKEVLQQYRDQPALTKDGHRITIAANLELVEEARYLKESGAEGVGLFRTEYLYLDREDLPSEDDHLNAYLKLIQAAQPYPVTIRTLDLGGDKFKGRLTVSNELNPAMGLRAIRLCLSRPDLFKTQLRAILKASASGETRIMFPMISGFKEFMEAKKVVEQAKEELDREGVPYDPEIKLGIMVEVPSLVHIAREMAEVCDFFSIGTNDLIQYVLAIDRGNEYVSHLYQPLHPAVLRIIKQIIDAAEETGTPVNMCGAMAADPVNLPVLLGLGLRELSMPMGMILRIKKIAMGIEVSEAEQMVRELLEMKTAEEIEKRVKKEILEKWEDAYALELEAFADEYRE